MQLRDVMTPEIETIRPDASVQQAAEKMASLDIGMLPVVEGEKLVGVITDRDIAVRATARGLDPKKTPVRDAMTEVVICGIQDQDVKEGARKMMDGQVRRLVILDEDKKVVGIVSLADLALEVEGNHLAGQVLREISEPTHVTSGV